ncbi:protein kinase domain-containing protein [Georgenia subflava]|uniref:protein kinase domain-containing protein n=1 Tax=Georgenia subflava TaxID=1622177 RepID=UPI00186B2D55|nr:DNA-directed RNA polymerase subunit alpha C-terminal domain-containing protein [Georgenia subflava]
MDDLTEDREGVVLKLARDLPAGKRLDVEADVLRSLDHPRVVRLLEGPLDVDGRRALLLTDAGKTTLADRLQNEGRATIEQLENYGRDLLEAVQYLESQGVFHRDVKPANLGIAPDRGTRKPRLTLFDLSLATEPVENLTSGTPGYLDPFLGTGRRRQYDRAAELYAVAVTLFEMAHGELPSWRHGEDAPASADDRVVIVPTSFDEAVAEQLTEFFGRALSPVVADRFANAAELGTAWTAIFDRLEQPASGTDVDEAARDAQAARATLATPLSAAGLSARALSGLTREDVGTVGELITLKGTRVNSIPGLGEQYRREIQRRVRQWREALLPQTAPVTTATTDPIEERQGIEVIAGSLVPRPSPANATEIAVVTALLGLDDADGLWPSVAEVADRTGVSRADASDALANATRRWRQRGRTTPVQEILAAAVRDAGGVLGLPDAVAALTFRLGSALEGRARERVAAGLVRAVVETDARGAEPTFVTRRLLDDGGRTRGVLVALGEDADEPGDAGERALDLAVALGDAADALVAERELIPADQALAELRAVVRATGDDVRLTDDQLLRSAVAAASRAALSSRSEVYPADLAPESAAVLALRNAHVVALTKERLRSRVTGRFPTVTNLPDGPALDEIVAKAAPGLEWDGEQYSQRELSRRSTTDSTVTGTATVNLLSLDRLLQDSLRRRSALTLAVHPRSHGDAVAYLARTYGVAVVDVAALVVDALRQGAKDNDADWLAVARLDAQPAGTGAFGILQGLAREYVPRLWAERLRAPQPVLLVDAAPLARYGLTDLLAPVFDLAEDRPAARWLLLPRRGHQPIPTLDGHPAPMGPDGWVDLPPNLDLSDTTEMPA